MNEFINKRVDELIEEYKKYGQIIIAYDFDGTVVKLDKTKLTKDRDPQIRICELLRKIKLYAHLILWTCRDIKNTTDDGSLYEAILWLNEYNVPWNEINKNTLVDFGGSKIFANIYLDDRAGINESFEILLNFYEKITKKVENLANE